MNLQEMKSENKQLVKSNDDDSWLADKKCDDEEQVEFMRDHIKSPSEQVAELKSSDKEGANQLGSDHKISFRSSKEPLPSHVEKTTEMRNNIDPDHSMMNQISFNEQVAELNPSDKKDTAAQQQESSTAMEFVSKNKHFCDALWQGPSQDTKRRQDIGISSGNENVQVEEQIKALINQNKALINQNQVMSNRIGDIEKQFMILSTQVAESNSSHFKGTDQLGIEENAKNNLLVSFASEESIHSQSLYPTQASNESTVIEEPCLDEGPTQQSTGRSKRRSVLFHSFDIGEEIYLESDIYSVFIISRNWEGPFFYSVTIALFQFVIIALVLIDLLQRSYYTIGEETLRIPPKIESQVIAVQFFSLVIAFITTDDMMVSLKMLVAGYDPSIEIRSPGASYYKFLIANITRFCEGFCSIVICLVIIMQSSEVLQLIMDFIAVEFVSNIDNIAFMLARDGYLGDRLKRKCEKVLTTKLKVRSNAFNKVINILFFLIFCPFLSLLVSVRVLQSNGSLLGRYACENLDVRFGEETLVFNDNVNFTFVGEGINKTFANSTRTLPQVNEKLARLPYQFFSGHYAAEKNDFDRLEEYCERPVYWETTQSGEVLKDSTSGKFYYCGAKGSWVFTIEALFDTPGVMANQARDECKWGWLMLSPPTEATILNDAPMEGWSIWTGSIELSTREFSISCTDCRRDEDCGLTHGSCDLDSRTCDCEDDWQGSLCQAKKPFCPGMIWVNEGESSREYFEHRPIMNLHHHEDLYYDRPLYYSINPHVITWAAYAGRRWFVTSFAVNDEGGLVSNLPHAYWDNNLARRATRYSDPTTSHDPAGLTWNEIEFSRSKGNFGPFGASFPVKGRFECIDVDCMNNPDVCGKYGTCVTRTEVGFDGVKATYNQCECSNFTGGYFCEHHPDQPYSRDMYNEYILNPAYYRKYNPDVEYLKFWVNETVKADVGVIYQEEDQDETTPHDDREL